MTEIEQSADTKTQTGPLPTTRSEMWVLHLLSISVSSVCVLLAVRSIQSIAVVAALFLAWRLLPAPFVFAIGITGVVTTVSISTPLGALSTFALWGILVPEAVATSRVRELGWLLAATLVFSVVFLAALRSDVSLFTVAGVGAASIALTYYGLHRYEKVSLDLVQSPRQQ